MTKVIRAALAATGLFGLVAGLQLATPGQAAEAAAANLSTAGMTVMSGQPVLALDQAVTQSDDDFSTATGAETPATLAALVEQQETADTVDAEQNCLAVSVYYEAKGEPLNGQLAVAETVLNRTESGRFPTSVCGVVRQPGQFSFVRSGQLPSPPRDAKAWRQAVAIARIAAAEMWRDVAPNALFFHAARVRANFRGKRIAQLGNHVFYR